VGGFKLTYDYDNNTVRLAEKYGLKKISAPHSSDFSQELGAALFCSSAYGIICTKK
jgi:hypothetical protein